MYYNIQPYNRAASTEENIPVSHHMTERLMGWAVSPTAFHFPRLMYNRQPYNRPVQTVENITVQVTMAERLKGWLRIGANYMVSHRLNEQLSGDMRLTAGRRIAAALEEILAGHVDILTGCRIASALKEALNGVLHVGADITTLPADMSEILNGSFHMGADIYLASALDEQLSGLVHMGADIYITPALYEVLNGYANVRNIAEYVTVITEPIPPGSVLVIDASNYTMTLQDGEISRDVIHWHKGDWLWISRGTISFTLSGIGSKSLSYEVFYHALYL